jgi:hypothetical protein
MRPHDGGALSRRRRPPGTLRGAAIDAHQLALLAPLLASERGVTVIAP